jgi:hypothetical protein
MFKAKISFNNIRWLEPKSSEPTKPGTTLIDAERNYNSHYENPNTLIDIDPSTFNDSNSYFVDSSTGDDTNPGTYADPFKTIQHAITRVTTSPKPNIVLKNSRTFTERLEMPLLPLPDPLIISSESGTTATIECPSDYPSTYIVSESSDYITSMISFYDGSTERVNLESHCGKSESVRLSTTSTPGVHSTTLLFPNLRVNNNYRNSARQCYCINGKGLIITSTFIPKFHYLKDVQLNPFAGTVTEPEIYGFLQRYNDYVYSVDPDESEFKQLYSANLTFPDYQFDWFDTYINPDEPDSIKADSIKFIIGICRNNKSIAPYITVTAETKKDGTECYLVFWKSERVPDPILTESHAVYFGEKKLDGYFPIRVETSTNTVRFDTAAKYGLYAANENYYCFSGADESVPYNNNLLIDSNLNITELTCFNNSRPRRIVYHELLKKYFCIVYDERDSTSSFVVRSGDVYVSENGVDFVALNVLEQGLFPIDIIIMNNVLFVSIYRGYYALPPYSGTSNYLYYSYDGIEWFHDYSITEPNWGLYENSGKLQFLACAGTDAGSVPALQSFQESLINNVSRYAERETIFDNIKFNGLGNCGRLYTEGNRTKRF